MTILKTPFRCLLTDKVKRISINSDVTASDLVWGWGGGGKSTKNLKSEMTHFLPIRKNSKIKGHLLEFSTTLSDCNANNI